METVQTPSKNEAAGPQSRSPGTRPRVLCVDDETNVLEGLRLHLEKAYQLSTATSPAEALALLEREGPCAVVISDLRMPEMDGISLLGS